MTATRKPPSVGDKVLIVYSRKDNRLTDTSGTFLGVSEKNPENWMIQIEKHTWEISNIVTWRIKQ